MILTTSQESRYSSGKTNGQFGSSGSRSAHVSEFPYVAVLGKITVLQESVNLSLIHTTAAYKIVRKMKINGIPAHVVQPKNCRSVGDK